MSRQQQISLTLLTTHHSPLLPLLRSRRTFESRQHGDGARIIRPQRSTRRRSTYRGYLPTREPRRWQPRDVLIEAQVSTDGVGGCGGGVSWRRS